MIGINSQILSPAGGSSASALRFPSIQRSARASIDSQWRSDSPEVGISTYNARELSGQVRLPSPRASAFYR